MSLPKPDLVLSSISTLSLNSLAIAYPCPTLGSQDMSLPQVKKRLLALRSESKKRRKVSRDIVGSSSTSQHHQDVTATQPTQPTVTEDVNISSHLDVDKSSREKTTFPQRLKKRAQRLWRRDISCLESLHHESVQYGIPHHEAPQDIPTHPDLLHRDSMFDYTKIQLASWHANPVVLGPCGEPVPPEVINTFFKKHPAGQSEWRHSASWEKHLAQHLAKVAKKAREAEKAKEATQDKSESPQSPAKTNSKSRTNSPSTSPNGKGSFFLRPLWRSRSSKRRQKLGKSPALDTVSSSEDEPLSPLTPDLNHLQPPIARHRPSKGGIVFYDDNARFERRRPPPVRCSIVAKPVDVSQIPVPAAPDLKPASSESLDLHNLAHATGRPQEPCVLYLVQFPLGRNRNPPSTPQLRPERRITPVPEFQRLESSSQTPPCDSSLSERSPILSAGLSATNVHQGFHPSSARYNTTTSLAGNEPRYIVADLFSQNDHLRIPQTRKRSSSAVTAIHHSPPSMHFPPTPPDSRHSSASYEPNLSHPTQSGTNSPPAELVSSPDGPADRDWDTCELSDTTPASLPDCPVYVRPSRDGMGSRGLGRGFGLG